MALEQVVITDAATGSQATVLVGFGFNCYRYVAKVGGSPVDVLWSAPDFEKGTQKPSGSGIPLLFPYPGRLRGTKLNYGGRVYEQKVNLNGGNAIHGFVLNRPWKVIEQTASRVVGQFQASERDPAILEQWPADFRLTVSYEVKGTKLSSTIKIENPDDKPLPYGFGTHGYFRVPLGAGGSADECVITVPVHSYWELADMLPTGRKLPAVGDRGLADGFKFANTTLDAVFSDIEFQQGKVTATIVDPRTKRSLSLTFDDHFTECVVFNPPHRQAICIEPYTCSPDQFSLAEKGIIERPQTLQPGEEFTAQYELLVE